MGYFLSISTATSAENFWQPWSFMVLGLSAQQSIASCQKCDIIYTYTLFWLLPLYCCINPWKLRPWLTRQRNARKWQIWDEILQLWLGASYYGFQGKSQVKTLLELNHFVTRYEIISLIVTHDLWLWNMEHYWTWLNFWNKNWRQEQYAMKEMIKYFTTWQG